VPTNEIGIPIVQTGPEYKCFGCGKPVVIKLRWFVHPTNSSVLDRYADHIWYLGNVLGEKCSCDKRVARLGDCITPLVFSDPGRADDWYQGVEQNALDVAIALKQIASYVPDDERRHDEATRVVYALLTHEVPPGKAIAAIREMLKGAAA
jgi:hypothetical protein